MHDIRLRSFNIIFLLKFEKVKPKISIETEVKINRRIRT